MVSLVPLTPERFEEFYQVFTILMREGYNGFSPTLIQHFLTNDYSKITLNYWLEKSWRRFMLAIDDSVDGGNNVSKGKIVGFLIGDNTYGGVGFISWVGTLSEYRGKGIGAMLVADYEKFAKSKKAHLLELFTYDKVKPFYDKLGFQEVGRRVQGFYGQNSIIMDKKIGEWDDRNLIKQEI